MGDTRPGALNIARKAPCMVCGPEWPQRSTQKCPCRQQVVVYVPPTCISLFRRCGPHFVGLMPGSRTTGPLYGLGDVICLAGPTFYHAISPQTIGNFFGRGPGYIDTYVAKAPWQRLFFVTSSNCSTRVHWFVLGAVIEPFLHVCLWDAKGSDLYMQPLIEELYNKVIPLTAKPLGFQRSDGWTCAYQSPSLLTQLLQTHPGTDFFLSKFTGERMPSALVTHVQDIVDGAPEVQCPLFWGFHCLSPLPNSTTTNLLYTFFFGAVYPIFIGSPSNPFLTLLSYSLCSLLSVVCLCICFECNCVTLVNTRVTLPLVLFGVMLIVEWSGTMAPYLRLGMSRQIGAVVKENESIVQSSMLMVHMGMYCSALRT